MEEEYYEDEEYNYDNDWFVRKNSESLDQVKETTLWEFPEMYLQSLQTPDLQQLELNDDELLKLFNLFKYDKNKILNHFFDNPEEYLIEAGISPKEISSLPQESEWMDNLISFENYPKSQFYYMECNHYYLTSDWTDYIISKVNDFSASPFLGCMQNKCNMILPNSFIKSRISQELYHKNQQKISLIYKSNNNSLKLCSAAGCNTCYFQTGLQMQIFCKCGFILCSQCNQEFHAPCNCKSIEDWNSNKLEDQMSNKKIQSICSQCPKCKTNIEKNEGCNYIKCSVCTQAFCWVCLTYWENHTQDHFKCNKLPKIEINKGSAKKDLEYYSFYYKRYKIFEDKQKNCKENMYIKMENFKLSTREKLNLELTTLDYLEQCVKKVHECMTVLKWSYVYGYYIDDEQERNFFQEQQGHLESFTNMLYNLQIRLVDQKIIIYNIQEYEMYKDKLLNWSQECMKAIESFMQTYNS